MVRPLKLRQQLPLTCVDVGAMVEYQLHTLRLVVLHCRVEGSVPFRIYAVLRTIAREGGEEGE